MTSNDLDTSKLLRLEVDSDITLIGIPLPGQIVPKNTFFTIGINGDGTTNIGFMTPSSGNLNTRSYTSPYYNVKVFKVLAPSISSFTASSSVSPSPLQLVSAQSYKLISGNSVTLNWSVASATATTRCELYQEGSLNPIKTFDNTDTDATNDFTLSGTTGSFSHTISSVTASVTYKVSCSHNGLGTTPQHQINIAVVPVPSVTKFLVKDASGATLADGRHQNAEKIGDDDQSKYSRRRTALPAGAKFDL